MSLPTDRDHRFCSHLQDLAASENRAALAALRRGVGKRPGEVADPAPYVVPWLSADASPLEEEAVYLVASLFALHQIPWSSSQDERLPSNLGRSFAILNDRTSSQSIERRFIALLNSHRDDLGVRPTTPILRA